MSALRWFRSLVKGNPDLYRAIYDWNNYPHRWALPARLEGVTVPASVVALLEKTPRGREKLGRFYCAALGLDETFWDFEAASRRLALLAPATLARLASFAGAALNWIRLARIVSQQRQRELTTAIGTDAYAFGLRRGRALTTVAPPHGFGPGDGELLADIRRSGWNLLAAALATDAAAVHRRFRLKSPPGVAPDSNTLGPDAQAHAWTMLQPVLIETLDAKEVRCFA